MSKLKALRAIDKYGVLLVFPENNKKVPHSLWSALYPNSKMLWDWNVDGDRRVEKLWRLMKELSDSREVIYTKWYKGRATFFSRKLFTALLCLVKNQSIELKNRDAKNILDFLQEDSPLSTRQVKRLAELSGRDNEKFFNKAMKELFLKFLIVAFGEVDDGAFPSLAVGATESLFEDLWVDSDRLKVELAAQVLNQYMPKDNLFRKLFDHHNNWTDP